jgi:hypothetical protein
MVARAKEFATGRRLRLGWSAAGRALGAVHRVTARLEHAMKGSPGCCLPIPRNFSTPPPPYPNIGFRHLPEPSFSPF